MNCKVCNSPMLFDEHLSLLETKKVLQSKPVFPVSIPDGIEDVRLVTVCSKCGDESQQTISANEYVDMIAHKIISGAWYASALEVAGKVPDPTVKQAVQALLQKELSELQEIYGRTKNDLLRFIVGHAIREKEKSA